VESEATTTRVTLIADGGADEAHSVDDGNLMGPADSIGGDAVRFYSLRLHEAGLIKSSPQKIIAQGTDWRFLNELKRELKG
jgi:hypothetical protein